MVQNRIVKFLLRPSRKSPAMLTLYHTASFYYKKKTTAAISIIGANKRMDGVKTLVLVVPTTRTSCLAYETRYEFSFDQRQVPSNFVIQAIINITSVL